MICFTLLKKIVPLLALALPVISFAGFPSVQLTPESGATEITITQGSVLNFSAQASDSDRDLKEHWIEIRNPSGSWSWEGWLSGEPWTGRLGGDASSSSKQASFRFDAPGSYQVRSTALDSADIWIISNVVYVVVIPGTAEPAPSGPVSGPAIGNFSNASFESLPVGQNDFGAFRYTPSGAGWVFSEGAGIAGNRSGFTEQNPAAPDGSQVGFIQFTGSITQNVRVAAGTYRVSAQAAQRVAWQQQSQVVRVTVDDVYVGSFSPNGAGYESQLTEAFTLDEGEHTIRFTGSAVRDGTMFLDQISLVAGSTNAPSNPAPQPPAEVPAPAPVPTPAPPAQPSPAPVTGPIFDGSGNINPDAYAAYMKAWDKASVSARFGPTFEQLNPGAPDNRPTLYKQPYRNTMASYRDRVDPFELGPASGPIPDNDYWSESGQVAYVPDDGNNPGLDRVQVFAYYDNVFALSPRLDYATGEFRPDPQTKEANYYNMLGFFPRQPVAMVRGYGMLMNEALVLYKDGLLGVAGTQTSRNAFDRPYPGLVFPAQKVPTGIAVTTGNEFALVTVWDTSTRRGQLAIVALEAKFIPFHTWPYMGMPNQGCFSDMKLLGYVDLPMAAPSAVAAASNGWWSGPSQTNGLVLSQIDLGSDAVRRALYSGDAQWSTLIANKGYAVITSKLENKATIVDLSPLFGYIRESYLSSDSSFRNAVNNRGSGGGQFPATFDERGDIRPRVVWETSVATPTAVLAGLKVERWSLDRHKAHIACEDGTIHIVDTSSLMTRLPWEQTGSLGIMGTVKVGRNPVSMCFTRAPDGGLPLIPRQASGEAGSADPLNNTFYVACRGDRRVDAVVTFGGQGAVYRTITDSRMGDPVGVSVAGRANIVSVTDFEGRKLLSFRVGGIQDRYGRFYGAGADGKADHEFAGDLFFPGSPFLINSANVN